jgi:RNA-binding protein
MPALTPAQNRYLKQKAHHVKPIAQVGKNGITPAFRAEVDGAIGHHELIKVKFNEFKEDRRDLSIQLAKSLKASLVNVVGNTAILFRSPKDPEKRKIILPGS